MRRVVAGVLALVVIVAAVVALASYFVDRPLETALTLRALEGDVQISDAGAKMRPVVEGMELKQSDRVVTGKDSFAILGVGGETSIRIEPTSKLEVRELDETGVRLELEEGLLRAEVRPSSGTVRVGNRGREFVASDADLAFGVRDGGLVIEATRGELMAVGVVGTDQITPGQRLSVLADGQSGVSEIPADLLLAVEWPKERRTRVARTSVTGATEAGATVQIRAGSGTVEVVADADGRFDAEIPLVEGANTVRVSARNVLGEEVETEQVLVRDTRGPTIRVGVEYEQ